MSGMNLDEVVSAGHGTLGSGGEGGDHLLDLVHRQGVRFAMEIIVGIIRWSDDLPAAILGKDVLAAIRFSGGVGRALAAGMSELEMMLRNEKNLNANLSVLGVDNIHNSLEARNEVVTPNANIATIEEKKKNLHRRDAALWSNSSGFLDDPTKATMRIIRIMTHDNVIYMTILVSGKLCS